MGVGWNGRLTLPTLLKMVTMVFSVSANASPWIEPQDWQKSFALKYMRYEMDDLYVDLDNPWTNRSMLPVENVQFFESRRKNRTKIKEEFSLNEQVVKEIKPSGNENYVRGCSRRKTAQIANWAF